MFFKNQWKIPSVTIWKHLQGTIFYKSSILDFLENKNKYKALTVVAFAEVIQQEASAWWWKPSES